MTLSVLIPALLQRLPDAAVLEELTKQTRDRPDVELIVLLDDGKTTTGKKLNIMMEMARGEYVSVVGDDDMVTEDYVSVICRAAGFAGDGVDAILFDEAYYVNGMYRSRIHYELDARWQDKDELLIRPVSQKMAIRRSLCLETPYEDSSDAEDLDFSRRIQPKLRDVYHTNLVLYDYRFTIDNYKQRKSLEAHQ